MNAPQLSHRHLAAGATVFTVSGAVDAEQAQELAVYIRRVRRRRKDHLVFDLCQARFEGQAGLQVLMETADLAHGHGGEVLLAAPPRHLTTLMAASKLHALVPVYATVDDAVQAALSGTRRSPSARPQ
ncbi:STAS domain-containing protein [Actinomadura sp. 7K507]|uniref:STAS domain-containing protein n=1 Tax=Actinomadura sp. 7K507 TaxID=2530365 RepID=UPI00104C5BD0|nr:STAS domain-containing protein [Actinomadura sp. 7K507]TDC88182.1 anti-sigma factor antagonist [Actinomadura sp. 7K507]